MIRKRQLNYKVMVIIYNDSSSLWIPIEVCHHHSLQNLVAPKTYKKIHKRISAYMTSGWIHIAAPRDEGIQLINKTKLYKAFDWWLVEYHTVPQEDVGNVYYIDTHILPDFNIPKKSNKKEP